MYSCIVNKLKSIIKIIQKYYKKDKEKTIFIIAVIFLPIVFLCILGLYFLKFVIEIPVLSDDKGDWGTFGDYMGGVLNPILAFMSFMALLYTIKLQLEELQATREELKRSADAQETQLKIFKQQQTDTIFFTLLKATQNVSSEILELISDKDKESKSYKLYQHIVTLSTLTEYSSQSEMKLKGNYHEYLKLSTKEKENILTIIASYHDEIYITLPIIQTYSSFIYEILKLINKDYSSTPQEQIFITILKRNIPNKLLPLLAIINFFIETDTDNEYLNLLEKYQIFENMSFSFKNEVPINSNGDFILFYLMEFYPNKTKIFSKNKCFIYLSYFKKPSSSR